MGANPEFLQMLQKRKAGTEEEIDLEDAKNL